MKAKTFTIGRALRLAGLSFLSLAAVASVRAQEIWLCPNSASDFAAMFEPNAQWQAAAAQVGVFKLYGSFLAHAAQGQVDAIVAGLNRRHIPIALEAGVINVNFKPKPACGGLGYVEGYGTPDEAHAISKKIKHAGGVIKYIAMDEPLFYGHYFKGKPGGQPGCQSDIEQVAALSVGTLAAYRQEFPDVVVGDIEPADLAREVDWAQDLEAWATAFKKHAGGPLAFLHLDVPFPREDSEQSAVKLYREAETLKRRQLLGKIGIIYDGNPGDTSDLQWVANAESHIKLLETHYGLRPDQAVIQSWHPHPTHAMPDSSSDSLTSIVSFYAARPEYRQK